MKKSRDIREQLARADSSDHEARIAMGRGANNLRLASLFEAKERPPALYAVALTLRNN